MFCVQVYATIFTTFGIPTVYSSLLFWGLILLVGSFSCLIIFNQVKERKWINAGIILLGTFFLILGKIDSNSNQMILGAFLVSIPSVLSFVKNYKISFIPNCIRQTQVPPNSDCRIDAK
jgi:hypothetical protein